MRTRQLSASDVLTQPSLITNKDLKRALRRSSEIRIHQIIVLNFNLRMVLRLKTIGRGLLVRAKVVAGVAVCAAAVTIGTAVGVAKAVVIHEAAPKVPLNKACEPETIGAEDEMCCEEEKRRISRVRVTVPRAPEPDADAEAGQAEEALGEPQVSLHVLSCESGESSSSSPRSVVVEAESAEPMTLLSRGANGKVYAQGTEAVKVIQCASATQVGEAELEFSCMKWLGARCPNICSARKLEVKQGTVSMWMERCAGDFGDVLDAVHCGSPSEMRQIELLGLQFLEQVARGLKMIHAAGMVHADIKPMNVLIAKQSPANWKAGFAPGSLKLADFGHAFPLSHRRTVSRALGTPGFLAPEMQALEGPDWDCCVPPGTESDMWSLGVSTWVVMTGVPYLPQYPKVMDWLLAGFTAQTQQLLRGLLQADPEQRLTAEELLRSPALLRHPLLLQARAS